MENTFNRIELSIIEGTCIFNQLKDCKIEFNQNTLNIEDKKYLSLYLGLIKELSKTYEQFKGINSKLNIQVNCRKLDSNTCRKLLNSYFSKIFENKNFNQIEDYLDYLLNTDIIKEFNRINKLDFNYKKSNKELILK